jgi:glycosyltransferase involved in cell wall biosynthesis
MASSSAHHPDSVPLRVLHYLSATAETGGTEHYVATLFENLDRQGYVSLLACDTRHRADLIQRAHTHSIAVHRLHSERTGGFAYLAQLTRLARLLRRERVHVLHVHAAGYSGFNALLAAVLARVPAILITHHQRFGPPGSAYERLVLWLMKHAVASIVSPTDVQVNECVALGIPRERIAVVRTGIDLRRFRYDATAKVNYASELRVLMAARFQAGKGHEELVLASARLAASHPHMRFIMLGDGDTRAHIQALIDTHGVGDVIELRGWVSHDEVFAAMHTAHVTVLPTSIASETTPLALLEGMATGLVAIGTRIGGIPEIIVDGESGFLVEPRDISALAAALERLATHPELVRVMGQHGRARVEQLFAATTMAQSYAVLYRKALAHRRRRTW